MATSFKKKGTRGRPVYPPGTRASIHNNQLLVSSGVPSMDNVLGGGIAVGTVIMVEEDVYGSYARQLAKYFLAEGVVSGHAIFLASAEPETDVILKDLPQSTDDKENQATSHSKNTEDKLPADQSMKIAWRYQNQPQLEPNQSHVKFGHYYDLTRVMDEQQIHSVPIKTFSVCNEMGKYQESASQHTKSGENRLYSDVLSAVHSTIIDGKYSTADTRLENRTILRIVLQGLGSPLWGEEQLGTVDSSFSLTRFLFCLRAILRSAFAVCFITVPTHLFQDLAFTTRVERLCDTVVRLESFVGSEKETNPLYKDYHGLFHIIRLPRLNSLTCHVPESLDLAFKLRRMKMTIEKLHLPPDLSESANRTQEDAVRGKPGTLSCQSTLGNSKLDF